MESPTDDVSVVHPILAGIVCALVGWTSSFAVVLAGLKAVGADSAQATSGLMALSMTMGLGCILFSLRWRMPITIAWSTPGAALLASSAAPATGFRGAVLAFIVTGLLLAACGLVRPLGRIVAAVPAPLANAMLAGVLLTLCVVPFRSLVASPAVVAPVLLVWLAALRLAPRWAIPAALAAALIGMGVTGGFGHVAGSGMPVPVVVAPAWDPAAIIALALPLFLVTMTSQNIAGMAVLASFGYRPPMGPALVYTGGATAVGGLVGGHAINFAAISAALAAGPEAHPDPRRRWVAGVSCGITYVVFGPLTGVVVAVVDAAPHGLIESVAGLALVAAFAGAAGSAMSDVDHRQAAAVTFLVAASGITVAGIGGAFWGLAAGTLVWSWLRLQRRSPRGAAV